MESSISMLSHSIGSIAHPRLIDNIWFRWLSSLWVTYILLVTGLQFSKYLSYLALMSLGNDHSGIVSYIGTPAILVIFSKLFVLGFLFLALCIAYGIIQRKTEWFKKIAFVCFLITAAYSIYPFLSAAFSYFTDMGNMAPPANRLFEYIIFNLFGAAFVTILPLAFIGFLLSKYKIPHDSATNNEMTVRDTQQNITNHS